MRRGAKASGLGDRLVTEQQRPGGPITHLCDYADPETGECCCAWGAYGFAPPGAVLPAYRMYLWACAKHRDAVEAVWKEKWK